MPRRKLQATKYSTRRQQKNEVNTEMVWTYRIYKFIFNRIFACMPNGVDSMPITRKYLFRFAAAKQSKRCQRGVRKLRGDVPFFTGHVPQHSAVL